MALSKQKAPLGNPLKGTNNVAKQSLEMSGLPKNACLRMDVVCSNDCLASSFYQTSAGLTISISIFLKQSLSLLLKLFNPLATNNLSSLSFFLLY